MESNAYSVEKMNLLLKPRSTCTALKRTLQIIILSISLLTSSLAFACEGENLKQTAVLVDQVLQLSFQIALNFDFNLYMQKLPEIIQAALKLPSSCQQVFQQWVQTINNQIGGLGGSGKTRCMGGVCCGRTGCS